jgi:cytidine kinase
MNKENKIKLVCVGSVALDTIATPKEKHNDVLGGSASFASAAASFFTNTGMVGTVGTDFPEEYLNLLKHFNINLNGFKKAEGKTFRWSGIYEENMNERHTLSTDLNVFADFSPELPSAYRKSPFLFLANIGPELQLKVLDQMEDLAFCGADTMDLWIDSARDKLEEVISKINLLIVNDAEVKKLTGNSNLIKASKEIIKKGPEYIIVKKGEHGSMLVSNDKIYILPAYPVENVIDPTGAGDAFAGGLLGNLAYKKNITAEHIFSAMGAATIMSSYAIQSFGLNSLQQTNIKAINDRLTHLKDITSLS